MLTANFYLEKGNVILKVTVNGSRVVKSTKVKCLPSEWDSSKQNVKALDESTVEKRNRLNAIREIVEAQIPIYYNYSFSKDEFISEYERRVLKKTPDGLVTKRLTDYLVDYTEAFSTADYGTKRQYLRYSKYLQEYEAFSGLLSRIDKLSDPAYSFEFFKGFMNYLFEQKQLLNSSVETVFKKINSVCNHFGEVFQIKTHKAKLFKPFAKNVNRDASKSVIITPEEAQLIWEYEPETEMEWATKMCYLAAYETGNRYSELLTIKHDSWYEQKITLPTSKEVVSNLVIEYIPEKSGLNDVGIVLVTKRLFEVLQECNAKGPFSFTMKRNGENAYDTWDNLALPVVHSTDINQTIKQICRKIAEKQRQNALAIGLKKTDVGLGETFTKIRYKGNQKIEDCKPRWAFVTFHTARHSRIDNIRSLGIDSSTTAELVNHSSKDTTEKYYMQQNQLRSIGALIEAEKRKIG